jgi:hypothetical protein
MKCDLKWGEEGRRKGEVYTHVSKCKNDKIKERKKKKCDLKKDSGIKTIK